MKPIRLLALSLVTTLTASAQTNTYPFPASGNVGIGTSDPWTSLHVQGPFTPGCMQLMIQSSGSDDRQGIAFYNAAGQRTGVIYTGPANGGDFILGREQSGMFRFFSGGGERLTIDSAGSVGIGTTSPMQKLEVQGGIGFSGAGLNPADKKLYSPEDGTLEWMTHNAAGQHGFAISHQGTRAVYLNTAGNSYLNGGNVGIGTANPLSRLTIQSDSSDWDAGQLLIHGASSATKRLSLGFDTFNNFGFIQALIAGNNYYNLSLQPHGGNVGIGTTTPTHKLAVNGTIKAKEVIVETTGWSDYVFADDYPLQPLSEVEAHIKTNKHLPGIPSAAQVAEQGVSLGDMQAKLLAKIEELTLHQIAQEKELASLRQEVRALRENSAK